MKTQAIAMGMMLGLSAIANSAEVDSVGFDWDDKRSSAANCGAEKPNLSTVSKTGGLFNTSGNSANDLTCSLQHDRWSTGYRAYLLSVYRAPGSQVMPCYLNVFDGFATTTQTHNAPFNDSDQYFDRFDYAQHSTLGCTAPKKASGVSSGIRSYLYTEAN